MFLTMAAVAAGWYASARNGISVDKSGKLVPAHASPFDAFLIVMYALMLVGLYITIAALSGSLWLPGVSTAENRTALLRAHRQDVMQMLAEATRQGSVFLEGTEAADPSFEPDRWERRTHDLIEKALGPTEAATFRNVSGLGSRWNMGPAQMVDRRMQRLHDLVERLPHLDVAEDFVPVVWAMSEDPSWTA